MKIFYLTRITDRYHCGWLEINLSSGDKVLLPYSTKVYKLKVAEKYEIIQPLEGEMANGRIVTPYLQSLGRNNYSFFTNKKIKFSQLHIHINKKTKKLFLNRKAYPITLSEDCAQGLYYVKFPIRLNKTNTNYFDEESGGSRFCNTWFPLIKKGELNLSRFLHYGLYSRGCITVLHNRNNHGSWSDIFFGIMQSRIDSNYLATIEIN